MLIKHKPISTPNRIVYSKLEYTYSAEEPGLHRVDKFFNSCSISIPDQHQTLWSSALVCREVLYAFSARLAALTEFESLGDYQIFNTKEISMIYWYTLIYGDMTYSSNSLNDGSDFAMLISVLSILKDF